MLEPTSSLAHVDTDGSDLKPLDGLLHRVASQDASAFQELYQYAAPRLYGIALKLTRDRQAASEALQDTMVQIWQRAARFNPLLGSAEAWMAGILRFRALDILASRKKHGNDNLEGAEEMVDETALDRLDTAADGTRLRRCLAELEQKNRRSIILAYVHGYSQSEIAARMEMPLGTVKAWVRRGLLTLKGCMGS